MGWHWSSPEIALRGPHLVVLAGGSGAGKSTWAAARFLPTQVVSSDRCRALVGDREDVQAFSGQAFELFYFLIEKRMELHKTTVADSTALDGSVRRALLEIAHRHAYPAALVILEAGLDTRRARNAARERRVPEDVLERQQLAADRLDAESRSEDWEAVYALGPEQAERTKVRLLRSGVYDRTPPPYDIVGDVHGCFEELTELLRTLGWEEAGGTWRHAQGRTLVSVGDLADRGPDVPGCFRLFIRLAREGRALFVPGNHDDKLLRALRGRKVRVAHGLEASLAQLGAAPDGEELRREIEAFIGAAPPYLVLDRGRLVVAHAGIEQRMIGKVSERIRRFTLYGDATGETTPEGLPVRRDWAQFYRGSAFIAYGHTPVPKPAPFRKTVNIDQGCVYGGRLTALRYPEMEYVQVRARRAYDERPGGLPWARERSQAGTDDDGE